MAFPSPFFYFVSCCFCYCCISFCLFRFSSSSYPRTLMFVGQFLGVISIKFSSEKPPVPGKITLFFSRQQCLKLKTHC